jgi:hypothetical protein
MVISLAAWNLATLCKISRNFLMSPMSLLQNPESEFDFFAARGEMEGAGAPFLA